MNNTIKTVLGVIIIILVIWGIASIGPKKSPADTTPIKIGFIGPLTGDVANIGQNAKAGVEIAIDEINKAGGINGRNIEVIYEDGKCSGAGASNAANKLIGVDKVSLILGGACSGETLSFTALAESAKVPVISYCSSVPKITEAGDYIFRNYPSDSYQGKFAAQYLYNTLGKKKVGILFIKTDWAVGIEAVFTEEFKKLGGQVVAKEGYEQTTRDFRTQLSKIKASAPDAVYIMGYTESVPAIKQAKQIGISALLFGADAWDDGKIWTEVGADGEGAMYSVVSANLNATFKANMKAKVNSDEIAACTPTAYDATHITAQVMKKAGTDRTAIKNELYKTVYTGGISSKEIKFDKNGDLIGANYIIKVVKNGKAEEVK